MCSWGQVARRIRVPSGFAFAALYLWLARPTWRWMAFGLALIVPGLMIRALASGYVEKNERLAMSGPYAYTRNPLYLGSLVLAVGFALAARSWWIGGILIALFLVVYLPVIRSEEAFLRERFPEFKEYAQHVPRLLPRLRAFGDNSGSFSWRLYWRHGEYDAALGALAMMAALGIKLLWATRWHN
jgi:protein-S-isoprenylcysteine O-methyltransferase Ste14